MVWWWSEKFEWFSRFHNNTEECRGSPSIKICVACHLSMHEPLIPGVLGSILFGAMLY